MKKLALGLVSLVLACGDKSPTKPSEPTKIAWNSIEMYKCPVDAKSVSDCIILQHPDSVHEAGRYYVHKHTFTGASYLSAKLTWRPTEQYECNKVGEECVAQGTWPVRDNVILTLGLNDTTDYRLEYNLLDQEQKSAADTLFLLRLR